jgi:colanic acid/amylovoran biosynthesis glycosyltransferase
LRQNASAVAEPVKLLYLIGQYPAINHSYLLAEIRHLRKLGFRVEVASISSPDRPLEKLSPVEREEAARTYYVKSVPAWKIALLVTGEFLRHPFRWLGGLFFALGLAGANLKRIAFHAAYFAEALAVGRCMRRLGLSHVHASFSATVALIMVRMFPVTMSFGVYGYGELQNPAETQLTERIRGALFVRSISRHGRGQLMLACNRNEWGKLVYVPLGIDATEFAPRSPRNSVSQLSILCVGRLAPEKGQSLLLEAIKELNSIERNVRLRLIGDGPDRKFLERRASELGVDGQIEFLGWVDLERLLAEYAEADMFVLPSLAEGIPMVLMEAMAMQIPCVAPCITGIPELIEHGVDGMLYAVADAEDLTAKIRALISSPELMEQIGRAARLRIMRDYDMARNAERFAAVLTERLKSGSSQE